MPLGDDLNTSVSHQLVLLWRLSTFRVDLGLNVWLGKSMQRFRKKSGSDLGKLSPLAKRGSVFGKNWLGSWENLSLILKNVTLILGKTATDFGKICHRL